MFDPSTSQKFDDEGPVAKRGINGRKFIHGFIRFAIACVLLWGVALPLAVAQESSKQENRVTGSIPRDLLDRPIVLRSGIGTVHQKVTTSSPQAQKFYDQGLAYVHSYMWIDAARSFHQALRLDPNMAMAYAGLVDTCVGLQDVPAARIALHQALVLTKRANEVEQGWITIRQRELEYFESDGDPDKYVAYRQAVNDALKLHPSDPWLWIQRGLADERSPASHGQAGGVDTLAFYKMALTRAPNNFVAHHYYAHTLENLGRAKEALGEADTYVRLAPAIPHAHHMRGHELMRLGHTNQAIQEFLKAKELEETSYRAENIPAGYDWHYSHNLQLLAMAYESLGQMKSAEAMLRKAFSLPAYTDFLDYNRREWPEFLLRRSRFAEALDASRRLAASQRPMARLAGYTLAGEALLALGRRDEAEQELTLAERETELLPPAVTAALPYPAILRANFLLVDKPADGKTLMQEIVEKIRAMPGPDSWSEARFELESIASTARHLDAWDLAEFSAHQLIEQDPNYAGGYFALGLVAEHGDNAALARQQFATAEKLWSNADSDLPELQQVRQSLGMFR